MIQNVLEFIDRFIDVMLSLKPEQIAALIIVIILFAIWEYWETRRKE